MNENISLENTPENTQKKGKKFYVGYGQVPMRDRRFLLKTIPPVMLGIAGAGAFLGTRVADTQGGRWESGKFVSLTGYLGFHPQPILWLSGEKEPFGIVLAGMGKKGLDKRIRSYVGQKITLTGYRIVRGNSYMLGVHKVLLVEDGEQFNLPQAVEQEEARLMGEILDAQCFMGIMSPGAGRTHRGCATQCVRGGQPVFFALGIRERFKRQNENAMYCANQNQSGGYLLAGKTGDKINEYIMDYIARPVILNVICDKIGNFNRLRLDLQNIDIL